MTSRQFFVYERVTCTKCYGNKVIRRFIKTDPVNFHSPNQTAEFACEKCGGTGYELREISLLEALREYIVAQPITLVEQVERDNENIILESPQEDNA